MSASVNCLEIYRRTLVREINREFGLINERPEEDPVHDFRVGVKRLTAFYHYLQYVDPDIRAKKILKRYRRLFKAIGKVRDLHIVKNLVEELGMGKRLITRIEAEERKYYEVFQNKIEAAKLHSIRVPTVISFNFSEKELFEAKKPYLEDLQSKICESRNRMSEKDWHGKRILLKRYHHTLDAFQRCPEHQFYESELKQIRMLEQLLGDWHDRVVTADLVREFSFKNMDPFLNLLKSEERLLLQSAKLYLKRFVYKCSLGN